MTVVPVPLLIRQIFDVAIPAGDRSQLAFLGFVLIGIMVASAGLAVVLRHHLLRVVQSHLVVVRGAVIGSAIDASMSDLVSCDEEEVRDALSQDTLRYSTMTSSVASELVPSAITGVAVAAVLLVMDPLLFATVTVLLLPVVLVHRTLGTRLSDRTSDYHRSYRSYTASITRLLKRAAVTRVHGAQELEREHQEQQVAGLETTAVRLDLIRSVYQWSLQSLIVLSALAVLLVGGTGVIDGSRTLGELFAFYAAVSLVRPALDTAVRTMPVITAGRQARARLEQLAATLQSNDQPGHLGFAGFERLDLVQVGLSYGDTPILRGLTFSIEAGTTTVVRGPNGAGKTTLIRLLCGLQKPSAGQIRLNGQPLDLVDLSLYRRHVGVVFQEAIVAGETVREALAYGDHEISDGAINDALAITGFDHILARLPHGLDTRLGHGAVQLSGGERQRLAIAQALVRRPGLLLLDEPTNHLDAEAVAAVVSGLPTDGPAVVVVTHEDSRRFHPDQIIELTLRPGEADVSQPPPSNGDQPMTSTTSTRFARIDGTFEMEVDGHTVVVDRSSEQMITLNGVAGLIWHQLAEPVTLDEIVDDCHGRFPEVDIAQIAADAQEFLEAASAAGLVVAHA